MNICLVTFFFIGLSLYGTKPDTLAKAAVKSSTFQGQTTTNSSNEFLTMEVPETIQIDDRSTEQVTQCKIFLNDIEMLTGKTVRELQTESFQRGTPFLLCASLARAGSYTKQYCIDLYTLFSRVSVSPENIINIPEINNILGNALDIHVIPIVKEDSLSQAKLSDGFISLATNIGVFYPKLRKNTGSNGYTFKRPKSIEIIEELPSILSFLLNDDVNAINRLGYIFSFLWRVDKKKDRENALSTLFWLNHDKFHVKEYKSIVPSYPTLNIQEIRKEIYELYPDLRT